VSSDHSSTAATASPGGVDADTLDRTHVVLRAYASPLPLGLFAFAVGNVLLAVAHLGGFGPEDTRTTMVMLATFIALPQLLAAVLGFLTREPLVATLLGLLAVTWPTDVVVQEYTGQATNGPRGVLFLALAGVLLLMSLPGFTAKPLFSALVVVAAARFVAGGLYDLTASSGWMHVSGAVRGARPVVTAPGRGATSAIGTSRTPHGRAAHPAVTHAGQGERVGVPEQSSRSRLTRRRGGAGGTPDGPVAHP
jgi:uncharacterized protein